MNELTTTDLDSGILPENVPIFNKFAMWLSLPIKILNQFPENEVEKMLGIDDPEVLEMIEIPDMKSFAEKYGVTPNTLTAWRKKIGERNPLHEVKRWVAPLAKNMMLALYNRAIRSGDAAMLKLFFQVANDWTEKAVIDHNYRGVTEFIFKLKDGQSNKDRVGTIAEAGNSPAISAGQGN